MASLIGADSSGEALAFALSGTVVIIVTIICWFHYSRRIKRRFAGSSLILLVSAYPIAQAVIIFVIYLAGCLVMIWERGYGHIGP